MIDPQLAGRVALVTGANHGIGAAIAEALATQGVRVFITYFRPPSPYSAAELAEAQTSGIGGDAYYRALQQQSPEAVLERIRAGGGHAVAEEADLARPEAIRALFDHCEAQLGPVDIVVANHTHCSPETFDSARVSDTGGGVRPITAAGIDAHFAVNARAVALLIAEYLARYQRRGAVSGRIVTISTDAAHAHTANVSYAASKHAIESYSRSAATELGRYGITVNTVAPGPIQTGYLTLEAVEAIAARTPLGRVGEPRDVADVVVLLAAEQARWITGQLLYVGGGWRMPQ